MNGTYIKNRYCHVSVNRIKRLSTEILNEYEGKFGTDFSSNKQLLNEVSIIRSKGLKNEIAGYITKILQRQEKFEASKQELIENDKKIDEIKEEPAPEPVEEPAPEPVEEPAPEPVEDEVSSEHRTHNTPVIEESEGENTIAEEILDDHDSEKTN